VWPNTVDLHPRAATAPLFGSFATQDLDPGHTLAGNGFNTVAAAHDDQGDAVVAWSTGRGVLGSATDTYLATRSADGTFGAPQALSRGYALPPVSLAMNDAGAAVALWTEWPGPTVMASFRSPGGGFQPARRFALNGMFTPQFLTINAVGQAVVASNAGPTPVPGPPNRISYALGDPSSGFGPVMPLTSGASLQQLLSDGQGGVVFLENLGPPPRGPGGSQPHVIVDRSGSGVFAPPTPVGPPSCLTSAAEDYRGDLLALSLGSCGVLPAGTSVLVSGKDAASPAFLPQLAFTKSDPGPVGVALNDGGRAALGFSAAAGSPPSPNGDRLVEVRLRDDPAAPILPRPPKVSLPGSQITLPNPTIPVRCDRDCTVTAQPVVHVGATEYPGSTTVRHLRRDHRAPLHLSFSASALQAARAGAQHGTQLVAAVVVTARDRSPRPMTAARQYALSAGP
jgi:hypothetical protein